MEPRLGRGLGSLLSSPKSPGGPTELEIRSIRPNPHQPRKVFDTGALDELKASIQAHGILQPVVVRQVEGEEPPAYELVSGERRWRAARLAGRTTVPAIIRADVSDDDMIELALVENVQRKDLDPIEKAQAFLALQNALQLSQEQVAEKVGLQRSTVANHLRLLDLPRDVQEAITQDLISMGHARALLGLADAKAQLDLVERIGRQGLSVRDVEKLVRQAKQPAAPLQDAVKAPAAPPAWVHEIERRLADALGTRVQLSTNAQIEGFIRIDYFGREDLERLLNQLAPKPELS